MNPPLSPPLHPAVLRPGVGFLLAHPAHLIAMGFGSGLSRIAPGTVGTAWAWIAYVAMQLWLPPALLGWIVLLSIPLGWWSCTVTAQHMRVLDSGHIVWDEVAGFWLVLWVLMPAGFSAQCAAFVLFRILDALKPGPIAWADGLYHGFGWRGGFGILFDDLVAAFCTLFLIAVWRAA